MLKDASALRVFCLVADCYADVGYYSRLWDLHFQEGVRQVTRKVIFPKDLNFSAARQNLGVPKDWADGGRADLSDLLWRQISNAIKKEGIDLVLSYCFSADLDPGVVKCVRSRGVPWVNFFCDSITHFDKVEELSRAVSLSWHPERAAVSKYSEVGAKSFCAPYAVNINALPIIPRRQPGFDVGFVGLPTSNRRNFLGALVCSGLKVRIGGHGWGLAGVGGGSASGSPASDKAIRKFRLTRLPQRAVDRLARDAFGRLAQRSAVGPIPDAELPSFIAEGKVTLGLNQTPSGSGRAMVSYMKFRDVEFPGMGTCYLTQHNEDVERAFEVGSEVETFKSLPELIYKAHSLSHNHAKRRGLQNAAAAAVQARHSWSVRLRELISHI